MDDSLTDLARDVSNRLTLRSAAWDGGRQVESRGTTREITQERSVADHGSWKLQVRFGPAEARPGVYIGTLTPDSFRLSAERVVRSAAVFGGVRVGADPVRSGEGSCRLFEDLSLRNDSSDPDRIVEATLRWEQLFADVLGVLLAFEAAGGRSDDPRRPRHGDRMTLDAFLSLPDHLIAGCELIDGVVWREDRLGA